MKYLSQMYRKICEKLLRLDMATLKTDSNLKKLVIKRICKPIGYFFRKEFYKLTYK